MLGYFDNWNIIQFNKKTTKNEDFDAVNKVLLDGNAINTADPTTIGYYVVNVLS